MTHELIIVEMETVKLNRLENKWISLNLFFSNNYCFRWNNVNRNDLVTFDLIYLIISIFRWTNIPWFISRKPSKRRLNAETLIGNRSSFHEESKKVTVWIWGEISTNREWHCWVHVNQFGRYISARLFVVHIFGVCSEIGLLNWMHRTSGKCRRILRFLIIAFRMK